jgi:hypothetical protein
MRCPVEKESYIFQNSGDGNATVHNVGAAGGESGVV